MSEPKSLFPPLSAGIDAAEIGFTLKDDGADDRGSDGSIDGWIYVGFPEGGDCRKFVTLEQDGMTWVGVRTFNHQGRFWQNNNEPERATVIAWRDLPGPARGRWDRGRFYLRR